MKNFKSIKIKAMALALVATMAISNVTAFAGTGTYSFEFGPLYSGPSTITSGPVRGSSDSNYVKQTTNASYKTTYYVSQLVGTSYISVTNGQPLTTKGTKNFVFTNGEVVDKVYYLKGVAENYGGRPGYTVKGEWGI